AGRLDDEERVAAGSVRDLDRLDIADSAAAGVPRKLYGVVAREGLEPDQHRVAAARAPPGPLVQKLVARERHDERPPGTGPIDTETLDQVEHRRLQRVRVLEDQEHRVVPREAVDHR